VGYRAYDLAIFPRGISQFTESDTECIEAAAAAGACVRLWAAIYCVRTKLLLKAPLRAKIDAGGGEGAVRLLGGGGGREGDPGFKLAACRPSSDAEPARSGRR
jgi:hypothetical protein